ncbi:hypothetical protein A3K73_03135 [Candidatus Pacearchaeota archaeon RBG_13_36_9]|nr:MAG: hypothetical protein A3K73_03135 [Candidatus Pacearchaeota archaeon RBG_13_36_9]HJX50955.1 hypothetical protein [Candidatus Nanoarchaeia archaeon]
MKQKEALVILLAILALFPIVAADIVVGPEQYLIPMAVVVIGIAIVVGIIALIAYLIIRAVKKKNKPGSKMPKEKIKKSVKKKAGNGFGIAGFVLSLVSLIFTFSMLYMLGDPSLIMIFAGLTIAILGIMFCSVQIVRMSSITWTIFSIISTIIAILSAAVDITLISGNWA